MPADPHWGSHLVDQQQEDVRFMLDQGETLERALSRVGISPDAWEKQNARRAARSA